jgi:PucR C-terminal helix-turn-helix domain
VSGPRHTGLRRVLDDLGATLLELLHGDPDAAPEVGGIAIHDPMDEQALPPHALVLGVGIGDPAQMVALLGHLGRRGAVGLVLRAPVVATPAVLAAADDAGVALLGLTRGATWSQLAAMLRALLAEGDVVAGESESLGGLPSGDLFALANAVAALLDAPITIEDRSNRVLAFSGRQDQTDRGREETVLGLQVPERYSRILTERGVFRELYRSDRPVIVDPVPAADGSGTTLPRAAIAVRAGDEVLGSIWAVLHEPLSAERADALCESAKLVALHLMRVRAGADVQRRVRADLVSTALEGGAGAREALTRLALADQPVVVLALALADAPAGEEATDAAAVSVRQRLADAFALHLSAVHPRSAAALVGHAAYGLVPVSGDDGEERAARIAADFLDRVGDRVPACIGIGPVSRDVGGVAAARLAADRALRVLRERRSTARVARLSDVYVEALMVELRDLVAVRGDSPAGPVARLLEYDAAHGSRLVETLRAWLDAFGDVNAAAAGLFVHPNTFRYRLRRIGEVGGIDLDDADSRFAALLELRLLHG